MARVFEGERTFLSPVFRPVETVLYWAAGVDETREQHWLTYTVAMLVFNAAGFLVVYALQRFQAVLPLNPAGMAAVAPDLAFNTAVSFTSNTNWQNYGGAREGMPEEHVREVSELASSIAAELGLAEEAIMRCRLAGWLHDIGKMALPDSVLGNPGELSEEEWVLMREHSEIGERIARRIPGLAQAAPAIRHHHERWDGDGYPDALAGEAIPIEARIVAVADAYSAMTHDRVHKRAMPSDDALAELRRGAGSRHDQACVEALDAVLTGRPARIRVG